MAVPSARNSGLESTEKVLLPAGDSASAALRMVVITSAVRTGRVLFSTTIVWPWAQAATWRAEASIQRRSLAWPAPIPRALVGVFTEPLEKCRLRPKPCAGLRRSSEALLTPRASELRFIEHSLTPQNIYQ
jgi:hypothetical protein